MCHGLGLLVYQLYWLGLFCLFLGSSARSFVCLFNFFFFSGVPTLQPFYTSLFGPIVAEFLSGLVFMGSSRSLDPQTSRTKATSPIVLEELFSCFPVGLGASRQVRLNWFGLVWI